MTTLTRTLGAVLCAWLFSCTPALSAYPPYAAFNSGQFNTATGYIYGEPGTTNATGAAIDFNFAQGADLILLTTNSVDQTVTLINVPALSNRSQAWLLQVFGDGVHTLTFGGPSTTLRSGTFVNPPPSGLNEYLFQKLGGVLYYDVLRLDTSAMLDAIGSTRGSLLYRGASAWSALTPGTSGNPLVSNGAGADPSYSSTLNITTANIGTINLTNPMPRTVLANGTASVLVGNNSSGGLADTGFTIGSLTNLSVNGVASSYSGLFTNGITLGNGAAASVVQTFDNSGTDVTLTATTGSLTLSGTLVTGGTVTSGASFQTASGSSLQFGSARSRIFSPADSQVLMQNAALTDFSRLMFGGTTASFPALARSTEYINIVDAAGGTTSGLMINGGTPLVGLLSATATLDFGSILTLASADLTITVTGAAVGDSVALGLPAAPDAGITFDGWVSAADTVTVRAHNVSSGSIDPASGTYRATVSKF